MLRTNQSFLSHAKKLYGQQARKEDIIKKKYVKGQRLLVQDEVAAKVMFIEEGITKCFFTENNDREYILEFLGAGEIIGEIELIRGTACLCSVEAVTDVTVYAFATPYFQALLKNDIVLNGLLLDVFAERIVNTSSRASYQQLYTIEHSLDKLLRLQLQQGITLPKADMAAYLGISVRSLNRELKHIGNNKPAG